MPSTGNCVGSMLLVVKYCPLFEVKAARRSIAPYGVWLSTSATMTCVPAEALMVNVPRAGLRSEGGAGVVPSSVVASTARVNVNVKPPAMGKPAWGPNEVRADEESDATQPCRARAVAPVGQSCV